MTPIRFPHLHGLLGLSLSATLIACGPADLATIGAAKALSGNNPGGDEMRVISRVGPADAMTQSHESTMTYDYRHARGVDVRRFVRVAEGAFGRVSRPIAAAAQMSTHETLRGASIISTTIERMAEVTRRGYKVRGCARFVPPSTGAEVKARTVRYAMSDCLVAGVGTFSGDLHITWGDDQMLAQLSQATIETPTTVLRIDLAVEWPTLVPGAAPQTSFGVEREGSSSSAPDERRFSITADRMRVDRYTDNGVEQFVVTIPDARGSLRWADFPSRRFDFDATMSFRINQSAANFDQFDIGGRYSDRASDGGVEVERIDLSFFRQDDYSGTVAFEYTNGPDHVRSLGEGDAISFTGAGSRVTFDGSLAAETAENGQIDAAGVSARELTIDTNGANTPIKGALAHQWQANDRHHILWIFFQDNSPSERWVRVFHNQRSMTFASFGSRPSVEQWLCARAQEDVVMPIAITDPDPATYNCGSDND